MHWRACLVVENKKRGELDPALKCTGAAGHVYSFCALPNWAFSLFFPSLKGCRVLDPLVAPVSILYVCALSSTRQCTVFFPFSPASCFAQWPFLAPFLVPEKRVCSPSGGQVWLPLSFLLLDPPFKPPRTFLGGGGCYAVQSFSHCIMCRVQ